MTMDTDAVGRRPLPASRPDRADLVVLAGYLLIALALGYLSVESSLRSPLWAVVLFGLAGVAAILVRQTRPTVAWIAVLVLLPLTAALGSTAEVALAFPLLFRIGVTRSARQAWVAVAVMTAVGVVMSLILALRVRFGPPLLGLTPRAAVDEWPTDWLSFVAVFAAVTLITALLGINVGHRRRHIAGLVERAEQLKRERDQQASIAGALERERIAREMHDVIAHSLSVMIALADGAQASADRHPEESRRAIGRVAETGRRTLGEVRRLLGSVRGEDDPAQSPLPATPGVDQLSALVDEFRTAGLPVHLEQTGHLEADAVIGLTIYRIVQESLTNTLRHARDVQQVLVRVAVGRDEVTIVVEDTSAPALRTGEPGRGLIGIRERVAFYDGHVTAGPRSSGGWRVMAQLPVQQQ